MKQWRSERGVAVTWFMVSLPALLVFMGLVIDLGAFMLRTQQLDSASDAAALAATDAWDRGYWKEHGKVRIDQGKAKSLARSYLDKNLPSARMTSLSVSGSRVNLRAEVHVPFFFLRIVGLEGRDATSYSTAVRRNFQ